MHKCIIHPRKIADLVNTPGQYALISSYNKYHSDINIDGKVFIRDKNTLHDGESFVMITSWGDLIVSSGYIIDYINTMMKWISSKIMY